MINYILTNDNKYGEMITDLEEELFANLVSVSFSSFENETVFNTKNETGIQFYPIGLIKKVEDEYFPKTFDDLVNEFVNSLIAIKSAGKATRWKNTIKTLYSDPIFESIGIEHLISDRDINNTKRIFEKLSSGHKIVLLTITSLVEKVEVRTLVILDEPELHLHPPY